MATHEQKAPLNVVILGASGSIGKQALAVIRENPDKVNLVAASVHSSIDELFNIAREFSPAFVGISDPLALASDEAATFKQAFPHIGVLEGADGLRELAALKEADCVLVAVVGAAGMQATQAALLAEKRVGLANKESLVAAGDILMPLAKEGQIIPVDSEHSAIFQCLMGETSPLKTIWLTCSGGPFYGFDRDRLSRVTAAEALQHPSWSMGPKITIDCATLANKGLEVIEAHHLFGVDYDQICVLIQPGSTIHSMVSFADGSTKAQLAMPTMKIPISLAFSYPVRWDMQGVLSDYRKHAPLSFGAPNGELFRCLPLAIEAGRQGGIMPAVMNAANEVANDAFRKGRIGFFDIARIIEKTMAAFTPDPVSTLAYIEEIDRASRAQARRYILEK